MRALINHVRALAEMTAREDSLVQEIGYLRNDLDAEHEAREAAESRVRELETELKEGDYWFKRLESFIANGSCPFCLASDCDGGHKPGCEMGEAEDPGEYWWKGAKSRVHELEQSIVDMRDRVILERERREQTEASCATYRDALLAVFEVMDISYPNALKVYLEKAGVLEQKAGRELLEQFKRYKTALKYIADIHPSEQLETCWTCEGIIEWKLAEIAKEALGPPTN